MGATAAVLLALNGHSQDVESHSSRSLLWKHIDKNHSECMKCGNNFNFFSRRHHCRLCQFVICGSCSDTSGKRNEYRVCKDLPLSDSGTMGWLSCPTNSFPHPKCPDGCYENMHQY